MSGAVTGPIPPMTYYRDRNRLGRNGSEHPVVTPLHDMQILWPTIYQQERILTTLKAVLMRDMMVWLLPASLNRECLNLFAK